MRPFVVHPGGGLAAPLAALGTIHKVSSTITGGQLAVIEHSLPPRQLGVPMHRHWREDELSIVITGRLGALLGEQEVHADAGSYLWKPRGQWHTFWNAGDTDLQCIELVIPGGLEGCFRALSRLLAAANSPEPSEIDTLAIEYGLEFDFLQTARICTRFGLTFG
jgi:quercetin dioxygenase-like cupin family protein